jgi:hypothetical protein
MVLVMVLPSVTIVVRTASVVTGIEEPAAPPAPPKMVVLPIVLVMVLPSVTIVVRIASVVTGTEEPAAPPAPPKMVVLPIVLVIVLPSVTMVVRTGAVETAEPLPPLPPPVPLAPVALPPWVKASVALRVTEEPEAPEAASKEWVTIPNFTWGSKRILPEAQ